MLLLPMLERYEYLVCSIRLGLCSRASKRSAATQFFQVVVETPENNWLCNSVSEPHTHSHNAAYPIQDLGFRPLLGPCYTSWLILLCLVAILHPFLTIAILILALEVHVIVSYGPNFRALPNI